MTSSLSMILPKLILLLTWTHRSLFLFVEEMGGSDGYTNCAPHEAFQMFAESHRLSCATPRTSNMERIKAVQKKTKRRDKETKRRGRRR